MSLFRRAPAVEQRSIDSLPWDHGGPGKRGLTAERAMSLVPVYAAVGLIARTVSSTPLQAYRRVSDNERRRITMPALFRAMVDAGRLQRWVFQAVQSLATRGNAFGLITARDGFGYPTSVTWLHPDCVTVDDQALYGRGSVEMPVWYWQGRVVQVGPANTPSSDIVHIPWFPIAGRVLGLSPLGAAASLISTGVSAQEYADEWFSNGGIPPGTMKNVAKTLLPAEAEAVKDRLVATIRARKPLVYGSDWDYNPIAIAPHEAKFVETAKLTATHVAAIYDVPPERIGGESGGPLHYTSAEQDSIHLVGFTFRNWYELLEEAFYAMTPQPQYVRFNVDSLLRADLKTRAEVYEIFRRIGKNSIDELRALEDEPPLPDGAGTDYTPLSKPEPAPQPVADPTAPPPIPLRRPA